MKKMTARLAARIATAKAEGYVDSGVKILIAVVIGALLLLGLYQLFNTVIMPSVEGSVKDMFNIGNTIVGNGTTGNWLK